MRWRGDYWFPSFQFHGARLEIEGNTAVLIAELSPVLDDSELARWFVTPNALLQDRLPLQAIQHGFEAVHDAARLLRFVHHN